MTTTPTWAAQKAKARRQAFIVTPILLGACGLGMAGVFIRDAVTGPDLDDAPAVVSTVGPTRSPDIFNPVQGAPPTSAPLEWLGTEPPVTEAPEPALPDLPEEEDEPEEEDGGSAYYANCAAARRAGAAPIYRGEPGYRRGLDRDGDGVACDW